MKPVCRLLMVLSTFLLLFPACEKDDAISEIPVVVEEIYANVPEALWDYFKRFEDEASIRGMQIDLQEEGISAEIMEISEDDVAGTCTYGSHEPGHIVIDEAFWNQAGDLFKEMIVFHELGHCSLHLEHREDAYANGACVSIMRSGLGDCIDNYRLSTRKTYLDELFESR